MVISSSAGAPHQVILDSEAGKRPGVDRPVTSRIHNLIFKAADSGYSLIYGFSRKDVAE
jgi:hypothetical protein